MDEFSGKSPNQILSYPVRDHFAWHFFQARSWLDYAKRSSSPSAIHYAAFELRYGIEHLLFRLLVLTSESLTAKEYQDCLGNPNEMKRKLSSPSRNYTRLAEFSEILAELDSRAPKFLFWKTEDLFRYWGIASEFLHFVGANVFTYDDVNWLIKSVARLDSVLEEIWHQVTGALAIAIMRPSNMEPEVHEAWQQFSSGTLDKNDLIRRLKIIQPVMQARRRQT